MKYPNVNKVTPLENYLLRIEFSTGEIKIFDVKPYIEGNWFGRLTDVHIFNKVRPMGNTVEWENGQDIAPHELYELSYPVASNS